MRKFSFKSSVYCEASLIFSSLRLLITQGNFEEVAIFLVESGANPNDVYTDDKGKEHNLLFDSVTLGNEVRDLKQSRYQVDCVD